MKGTSPSTAFDLLRQWLERQLPPSSWAWLADKMTAIEVGTLGRDFYLAISLIPRKIGKDDLILTTQDIKDARQARSGWMPVGWSLDQAARIALLLSTTRAEKPFVERFDHLCLSADVSELITFYRGLPLYPDQDALIARAREGVRTNIKVVFEAVAHYNPYPMEQFDNNAWNHMVLKALFMGSTLHQIIGLDERCNSTLMRMLCDYAHERWAAGRETHPELWRCVGPFADQSAITDLQHALASKNPLEREAAALALSECPIQEAQKILETVPELCLGIDAGRISWENIFRAMDKHALS